MSIRITATDKNGRKSFDKFYNIIKSFNDHLIGRAFKECRIDVDIKSIDDINQLKIILDRLSVCMDRSNNKRLPISLITGVSFLHRHPQMEAECDLPHDHVIVDKNDWELILKHFNENPDVASNILKHLVNKNKL